MCLWNMNAPGGDKVKIRQNLVSPTYWPRINLKYMNVMLVKCKKALDELIMYSPSLVTVWPPKL